MDSVIQQLNKAVGNANEPIMNGPSAKLGISPIPIPNAHQSLPYAMTHFACPVALERETDASSQFWLPCDPQISVSGGNSITKKEIANGTIKGTIKEFWKNDDCQITIAGILMSDDFGEIGEYVNKIRSLCEAREVLKITCEMLNDQFNITRVVVEKFDFPATDGIQNQYFTISCVSDDSYNLTVD